MTEYDYSPDAYERFLANQHRVSNWAAEASAHAYEFESPFDLPSSHHRPSHSRSHTLPNPRSPPPPHYPQPTSPRDSRTSSRSRSHSHHSHHSHSHSRPQPVRAQTQFYAPPKPPVSPPYYHDRDLYRAFDPRTGREVLIPVTNVGGQRVLMMPPGGHVMSPEPMYAAHLSNSPAQYYHHPQPLLKRLFGSIPWSSNGGGSSRRRRSH